MTDEELTVLQKYKHKELIMCKIVEVIMDGSVDVQEILDMMLTLVESTIQKTNSGAN